MQGIGEMLNKGFMPYADTLAAPLIGKVVNEIEVNDDATEVTFWVVGDDGKWKSRTPVTYRVQADCCSDSWIEHLTYPLGAEGWMEPLTITGFEESEGVETDERIRRGHTHSTDVVMVYQSKFTTDKGDIVIEYRNDSNGYYGGWLELKEGE